MNMDLTKVYNSLKTNRFGVGGFPLILGVTGTYYD